MVEIIVLLYLTRHIGQISFEKGYKPFVYKLLTIGLWIFFEFLIAIIMSLLFTKNSTVIYIFALLGAGCGGLISYLIVNNLKDKNNYSI
jgi:hypothetical protein